MSRGVINIGVIGCSSIAERSTIPAILQNDAFHLVAVGSRNKEKAMKFAQKFNCAGGSFDDIITNKDIEAVYVPLPTGLHYEWGMKVINAGKNLLMEKPFTDSYKGAIDIINMAVQNKVIAMEFLTYVYHPLIKKVFDLIKNNEIGRIRSVDAAFGFPNLPPEDFRNNPALGGGAILDNLIYPLSFSLKILENSYQHISYKIIENTQYHVDSSGFLRIDSEEASANISYGFRFYYRNSFTVWGENGLIFVDRAFTRPKDMEGRIVLQSEGKTERIITIEPYDQFYGTIQAFSDKIRGLDKTGVNEGQDILQRMEIISEMSVAFRKKQLSGEK